MSHVTVFLVVLKASRVLAACFLYWMIVIEPLCLRSVYRPVTIIRRNNSKRENSISFLLKSHQLKFCFSLAVVVHLDVTWSTSIKAFLSIRCNCLHVI